MNNKPPPQEPMVKIPEWLNVHQRPMRWLQILCRFTGTAFTAKNGYKYGDHSVFEEHLKDDDHE